MTPDAEPFSLSETAERLAVTWGFQPTEEIAGGWCSHVYADATRVLKEPWRGEEQTSGYRAALALSGWWGPTVFQSDEATGSVLMERVCPGTTLADSGVSEGEARQIAVGFIKSLQGKIEPQGYISLSDYFQCSHPLLNQLLETTSEVVFLHGDLHHFNLLKSDGPTPWVPIDPKGLAGDPAFEPVAFLRNLIDPKSPLEAVKELIGGRLAFFESELGLDRWRMAAWGLVDQIDADEDGNEVLAEAYRSMV